MNKRKFTPTLFASALLAFAQQISVTPVSEVTVTVQTATTGARQIIVTNSTNKTITALVMASEVNSTLQIPPSLPANAPSNARGPIQGGLMRTSFAYDAAINPKLNPIEHGTANIEIPLAKGGSPVITAVVYADGSSVGDQMQLARITKMRKDISDNLKAVIADTQAAISAKTADDFDAIMSTKVQSVTAPVSGVLRPAIDATYGDLARLSKAQAGAPFQMVQTGALPKALDNFKKRLATLQQLVPGL